jgi:hypothetical protein
MSYPPIAPSTSSWRSSPSRPFLRFWSRFSPGCWVDEGATAGHYLGMLLWPRRYGCQVKGGRLPGGCERHRRRRARVCRATEADFLAVGSLPDGLALAALTGSQKRMWRARERTRAGGQSAVA